MGEFAFVGEEYSRKDGGSFRRADALSGSVACENGIAVLGARPRRMM